MLTWPELADLYAYPALGRPWVRSNFVSSVDGAAQGENGLSGSLGGEADKRAFTAMRSLCDVVLAGAGTARAEGYRPISADSLVPALRSGKPNLPVLALVSKSLTLPESLLTEGVVVVTTTSASPRRVAELAESVEVLQHGDADIDWAGVFAEFCTRGWNNVLVEGGPTLHGELIVQDLIDELCLTIAPTLIAGPQLRIAKSDRAIWRDLELGHCVVDDGVLLTRWCRA